MAKSKEAPKEETTALEKPGVSALVDIDYGEDVDGGYEHQTAKDIGIP